MNSCENKLLFHLYSYFLLCPVRPLGVDFQVELPVEARAHYRFAYNGGLYQLKRMPMGHACAPEIQHIATSVLAGDGKYTSLAHRFKGQLDIYLDGIRFSGTAEQSHVYEQWLEERAKDIGMTFKPSDSYIGTNYNFLGIEYDHSQQKCRIGERFLNKIPKQAPELAQLHVYESLIARLIYASAVSGILLPKYYWVI